MDKPPSIDRLSGEVSLFPPPAPTAKLITRPLFWSFNFPPTPAQRKKNKQIKKNSKKGKHPNRSFHPARLPIRFISFKRKTKSQTKTRPNLPPRRGRSAPRLSRSWRERRSTEVTTRAGSRTLPRPPKRKRKRKEKTNPLTLPWGREGPLAARRGSETEKSRV